MTNERRPQRCVDDTKAAIDWVTARHGGGGRTAASATAEADRQDSMTTLQAATRRNVSSFVRLSIHSTQQWSTERLIKARKHPPPPTPPIVIDSFIRCWVAATLGWGGWGV